MSPSSSAADGWSPLAGDDLAALLEALEAHFGLPPAGFASHTFWRRSPSGSLWVAHADVRPFGPRPPDALGLRVRRGRRPPMQLANPFLRRFGPRATRHVWEIEGERALRAFFDAEVVPLDRPDGYYIARCGDVVLGRARVHRGAARAEIGREDRGAVLR